MEGAHEDGSGGERADRRTFRGRGGGGIGPAARTSGTGASGDPQGGELVQLRIKIIWLSPALTSHSLKSKYRVSPVTKTVDKHFKCLT